ncbi:asparagine synthase (glutamine-hydrolyzing) [Halorubrum alkaliphilum]|uniref:Asparagine synthase (Glutamine-hydrolyzing) n=1 Tax=Halorubrum alkaliphilum TaxID=261290 RepID=A0A8T4GDT7_9EURY|nr:asparagine synthase-related protein [Halorubrum alkaliphilum]MBP1921889.1 asparagine synthase (glutamine-hydrolyzing) [Halorubrum alkaliphilum]
MDVDLRGPGWVHRDGVVARGRAFDGDDLLDASAIAERFADDVAETESRTVVPRADPHTAVTAAADDLEGFYAAVVEDRTSGEADAAILVADGARSIPLYYGTHNGSAIVSDRGRVVRDALDASTDPVTESEFLLTRYVSGPETIWTGVRSTRAGAAVRIDDGGGIEPTTYRDHWPDETEPAASTVSERPASTLSEPAASTVSLTGSQSPRERLESGLERAFDRAVRIAGDRPVVVPLSGGYDSRLVASEFVARGHDVIGFTFGRSGHPDVEVSREVAARLGIEWRFVPYDAETWHEWYGGPAGETYRRAAFGGDALPFLAEWPAVRTLVAEGQVPADALWCPGHTVATPGERLPRFADPDTPAGDEGESGESDAVPPTVDALADYVRRTHYSLWEWDDDRFNAAVDERIRRGLLGDRDPDAVNDAASAAAAYERWEWRARMTTFTNGDLRAYENAGVETWLPLWDPAYVRAYASLPRRCREDKRLHSELAVDRYRAAAGLGDADTDDDPDRRSSGLGPAEVTDRTLAPIDRHLSLLRHTPVRRFTERDGRWDPPFLAPRGSWGERGSHPLAWDAIVDPAVHARLPPARNLYAIRTLAATNRIGLGDPESVAIDRFVSADRDGETDGSGRARLRLPTETDGT